MVTKREVRVWGWIVFVICTVVIAAMLGFPRSLIIVPLGLSVDLIRTTETRRD